MALVISRVARPRSKRATSRWWADTTLANDFGVGNATTDDIYSSMDWPLERQGQIETSLARRHLSAGSRVLYDLSSSWIQGNNCPLAKHGYSRDHKRGKTQIEYRLLTDQVARPVSIEVFAGNTSDPTAFVPIDNYGENFTAIGTIFIVRYRMFLRRHQSKIEPDRSCLSVEFKNSGHAGASMPPALKKNQKFSTR